ncbi:MAG: ABC transporter ATP-binding protein [Lachnospiraceae bacterium]|nr:ABC transporter ATP-binding protein [Lachnospiraceae bacterium]
MEKTYSQKEALLKTLQYTKKYKILFAGSILFSVINVGLGLYIPMLAGEAVDRVVGKGKVDFEGVYKILVIMGICIAIASAASWFMVLCNNKIAYSVVRDVRKDAFEKLQILPLKYIDGHPTGEVVSKIIADVDQMSEGLLMGFSQLFTGLVTIFGTLFFLVKINWKIALVVVCITPVSLFVASFIARRTYSMFKLQSETRAEQTALIDEVIGNQKLVKAFGREDEELEQFDEINERLKKYSLRAIFFSSLTNPGTRFVNSLVYAGVAISGGIIAVMGGITVGNLQCVLTYANQYTKPFNEISGVITELQNAIACAGRVFALIDEEPQIPDSEDAVVLMKNGEKKISGNNNSELIDENNIVSVHGKVNIEDVSFSYDKNTKLIENLNVHIKPGMRVAIVGPTGCGKTTIINLLMRFYDVDKGSIKVEENDIRDIKRSSLRKSYGMVLQDTWLKEGTIKENIITGKPDATDEEIIAAAKAAHAHSFIKRMKDGYDTLITEDGGNLSQGQKQLLCIARVMLCLPPMLILDEATSSIDTRTELKIQSAFEKMMKGRTSFIVAHRLSTIENADIILVMRDGKIIEQGNHEELLELGGFYSELYNSQYANK